MSILPFHDSYSSLFSHFGVTVYLGFSLRQSHTSFPIPRFSGITRPVYPTLASGKTCTQSPLAALEAAVSMMGCVIPAILSIGNVLPFWNTVLQSTELVSLPRAKRNKPTEKLGPRGGVGPSRSIPGPGSHGIALRSYSQTKASNAYTPGGGGGGICRGGGGGGFVGVGAKVREDAISRPSCCLAAACSSVTPPCSYMPFTPLNLAAADMVRCGAGRCGCQHRQFQRVAEGQR